MLSLTRRGRLAGSPVRGPAARYYRKLGWTSANSALLADLAMAGLGGTLKRKGVLTRRFADVFAWMHLGDAVLARFEAEGRCDEDVPLLHWTMQYALAVSVQAEAVVRKIKRAVRKGTLPRQAPVHLLPAAVSAGIVSEQEAELVVTAEAARDDVVQVDSFTPEEYFACAQGVDVPQLMQDAAP